MEKKYKNSIIKKIKNKGLRWLFARIKQEIFTPTKPIFLNINYFIVEIWVKIKKINHKSADPELLYGIYDFNVNDITYNFAVFLMDLEFESIKRGGDGFVVVFVPAGNINNMLSYEEYDSKIDADSKIWRLNNLLLPIMALSAKCKGFYFLPSRADVKQILLNHNTYPDQYDINITRKADLNKLIFRKLSKPGLLDGLRSSIQANKYIENWKFKKNIDNKVVTITIRDSAFDTARNSKINEWIQFAEYLKNRNFYPVFIPDTDNAFIDDGELNNFEIFRECAWNVGLRMALYESSYLNFFSPNGCAVLAMFNKYCSYIAMNMVAEGSTVATREAYKSVGHVIGESYKFSTSRQRLCFKSDIYENIKYEFENYLLDEANGEIFKK